VLRRDDDWPYFLERYLIENEKQNFQYGHFDCCLFAAGAIEAMTGVDLAEAFRGHYANHKQAMVIVRKACGRMSFVSLAAKLFEKAHMPEVAPQFAQRGDVVLIRQPRNHSLLGIVALDGIHAMIPIGVGLSKVPIVNVERAWRV